MLRVLKFVAATAVLVGTMSPVSSTTDFSITVGPVGGASVEVTNNGPTCRSNQAAISFVVDLRLNAGQLAVVSPCGVWQATYQPGSCWQEALGAFCYHEMADGRDSWTNTLSRLPIRGFYSESYGPWGSGQHWLITGSAPGVN